MAKKISASEIGTPEQIVQFLHSGKRRLPEMEEFAKDVIEMFGGPKALAKELKETYDMSFKMPGIRAKILDAIIFLIKYSCETKKSADLKDVSTKDLEAIVKSVLSKGSEGGQEKETATSGSAAVPVAGKTK
jgi:hypothetical protein